MGQATRLHIVVTVKAYPAVSTSYGEVVCVAGIRTDPLQHEWIRLFPIDRDTAASFKKWDEISIDVVPHSGDSRPESRRPLAGSMKVLGHLDTKKNWAARRPLIESVRIDSMCQLRRAQKTNRTSLGVFPIKEAIGLQIEASSGEWRPEQEAALQRLSSQMSLLIEVGKPGRSKLEKIPYAFKLTYRCHDRHCRLHTQTIVDWEIGQAFRSWRRTYGEKEALKHIRSKWLDEICSSANDTHLFAGNMHQHPEGFLVLGMYYPRSDPRVRES